MPTTPEDDFYDDEDDWDEDDYDPGEECGAMEQWSSDAFMHQGRIGGMRLGMSLSQHLAVLNQ